MKKDDKEIDVTRLPVAVVGSCSFCNKRNLPETVYVVKGLEHNTTVRFCHGCLHDLKQITKYG